MKRRILVLLLSILMLVSMIPTMGVFAADGEAATEETTEESNIPAFPTENVVEIATAEDFNAKVFAGGNFKLTADISGAAAIETTYNVIVNLDLNGHTIQAADASTFPSGRFIRVVKGGVFSLYDTVGGGKIIPTGDTAAANFLNMNNGVFNMYGGEISGWKTVGKELLRQANSIAQINLYGGKISNCSSDTGFFYVTSSATVNIYDPFVFENNDLSKCPMFVDSGAAIINIEGGIFNEEITAKFSSADSKIVITGGSFKVEPNKEFYDADNSELVKDGDYYVLNEIVWVEIATVEEFNTQVFAGGNFRLTADIIGAAAIETNYNIGAINLDLNGHTLQAADASTFPSGRFIRVVRGAILNIYDKVGGGKIIPTGDTVAANFLNMNNGIFNMYGGEISGWKIVGKEMLRQANPTAQINLYGGKISNCSSDTGFFYGTSSATVNIYDPFVFENNDMSKSSMFVDAGDGIFNIYGGTFDNEVTATALKDENKPHITGGLFKVEPDVSFYNVEAYEVVKEGEMFKVQERVILATDNGNGTHIVLDPSNPDVGKNMPHSGGKATCTTLARCELCVVEYGELAPHNQDIVEEGREATCSKFGSTAEKKCSVCGTVVVSREVIPQLEHTPGDWETVKEAAVGVEGLKVQKCTDCGKELNTEKIAALTEGGTPGTDPGTTDPGTTEPGTTEPDDGFPIVIVIVAAVAVVAIAVVVVVFIKKKK